MRGNLARVVLRGLGGGNAAELPGGVGVLGQPRPGPLPDKAGRKRAAQGEAHEMCNR